MESTELTSRCTKCAFPFARSIFSFNSLSFSTLRAQRTTVAPALAMSSAIPAPIPSLAPVTTTILPSNLKSTFSFLLIGLKIHAAP